MAKEQDRVQVNYWVSADLDRRIKIYQHQRMLNSKAEAYRELLEKGLAAAEQEREKKAPKP